MAEYILHNEVNGKQVNFKKGEYFPEIGLGLSPAVPEGTTICANFKTTERGNTVFAPTFTIAADGLSALHPENTLKLEFGAAKYISDVTAIYPDGGEQPLGRLVITIEDTTC